MVLTGSKPREPGRMPGSSSTEGSGSGSDGSAALDAALAAMRTSPEEGRKRTMALLGNLHHVARGSAIDYSERLLRVCHAGNVPAAKLLLSLEAASDLDVNLVRSVDNFGLCSPLTAASSQGNVELVELLLKAGADPTLKADGRDAMTLVLNQDGSPRHKLDASSKHKLLELITDAVRKRELDEAAVRTLGAQGAAMAAAGTPPGAGALPVGSAADYAEELNEECDDEAEEAAEAPDVTPVTLNRIEAVLAGRAVSGARPALARARTHSRRPRRPFACAGPSEPLPPPLTLRTRAVPSRRSERAAAICDARVGRGAAPRLPTGREGRQRRRQRRRRQRIRHLAGRARWRPCGRRRHVHRGRIACCAHADEAAAAAAAAAGAGVCAAAAEGARRAIRRLPVCRRPPEEARRDTKPSDGPPMTPSELASDAPPLSMTPPTAGTTTTRRTSSARASECTTTTTTTTTPRKAARCSGTTSVRPSSQVPRFATSTCRGAAAQCAAAASRPPIP